MSWHHHCIFVYVCFTPIYPIWVKYEKSRVVIIEFTILNFFKIKEEKEKCIIIFSNFS